MSGLLALLDDVAGIAKVAAASIDDVAGQAAKAGAKAAGAVIDDAAVTPKYVHGFAAARELPIVGKIALGSIRNKLLILLPAALLLSAFAPWAITPLLMLAVKTRFILSPEFMTIALAGLPAGQPVWMQALTLAVVAIGITAVVYGGVALIVKADDFGLWLNRAGKLGATRALGQGIVRFMPWFMRALMVVGTAAMIWVGGNIVIHGLAELGWHAPYDWIHHQAGAAAEAAGRAQGLIAWAVTAFFDGIFGLIFGLVALIPLVTFVILPVMRALTGKAPAAH